MWFQDDYSGDVLAGYVPSLQVSRLDLPRTIISGPVTHEDLWTDGAILVRDSRPPRKTDVLVEFHEEIDDLLTPFFRVDTALLLFLGGRPSIPLVLMLSGRIWQAFNVRYVDFAVKTFRNAESPCFWLNRTCTGCILTGGGAMLAYISRMALGVLLEMRTNTILEKAHAYSRD